MTDVIAQSYLKKTHGGKKGIWSWLFTYDHKRIGVMYLYLILAFFAVGVLLGFLMKMEKMNPGQDIVDAQTYNMMFTLHGVIMIFMVVIPGLTAIFGNFAMPIMIGAPDVAFPKLNLFTFYLYIFGSVLALASLFIGSGPADTGWTFYTPYSSDPARLNAITISLLAAATLGFSSILTGLNFIVTMHRLRAPGMTWMKMPLFPWMIYAAGWIQVLATPMIGITLLMLVADRTLGIGFFDPALGGDPILFQHMFWIYAHPAVYIIILPSFGVITEIIVTSSRKNIFGYKAMVYSGLAIAFIGYFVWAHHMFTSGISTMSQFVFSIITYLVAIPTAIKVFNWLTTMHKGSIHINPPFLFAMSYMFLFMIGGLTGLILGALSLDIHLHDTTFVVAHFHYVVFGGVGFSIFAGVHYWFPKMFGKMYNIKFAYFYWAWLTIGFNVLYFPMFISGMQGMPRRYFDYLPMYHTTNIISSIGGIIVTTGVIMMFWNLIRGYRKGAIAPMNPWGGITLEWTVPSPPTWENFEKQPVHEGKQAYNYK